MRRYLAILASGIGLAVLACALPDRALAASNVAIVIPPIDPASCVAAATASDDDKIIASCSPLIDSDKTGQPDRIKALVARAGAYDRKEQLDRAIGDFTTLVRLDPERADAFNTRGELWRRKGDRPRALADFGAAIKLNPQHEAARANYKSLALELERIGAEMAIKSKAGQPLK